MSFNDVYIATKSFKFRTTSILEVYLKKQIAVYFSLSMVVSFSISHFFLSTDANRKEARKPTHSKSSSLWNKEKVSLKEIFFCLSPYIITL